MNFKLTLAAVPFLFSASLKSIAANEDAIVLAPDGNYVDVILHNMDHQTGVSIDPADQFPSDYGYMYVGSEVLPYFQIRLDKYVTPDAQNLSTAFGIGGTIILDPGTYYISARYAMYSTDDEWLGTRMDWVPFDAGDKDFILKGAEADKAGPTAKIITDQFLHMGADPDWNLHDPSSWPGVRSVIQRIENITFDNSEYIDFRQGLSSTLIGQLGKVDVAIRDCVFLGGGITFHTVGSLIFESNEMVDTTYGVELASNWEWGGAPADADVSISKNQIRSQRAGVTLYRNGTGIAHQSRAMEVVENEILVSEWAGIDIDGNFGSPVIWLNDIQLAQTSPHAELWAGIGVSNSDAALVKNNKIVSSPSALPYTGIWVWASANLEVKANTISGTFEIPLFVSPDLNDLARTSDFNLFIDNNLRKSSSLIDYQIVLNYGTSNNVVKGSGVAGKHVSALDAGTDNHVEGLK